MEITKLIKTKIKEKKIVIGYKEVMRLMKTSKPELVIIANDFPEEKKKIVEYNAKISKTEIKEYQKDCVSLGLLCGKPFPIGILAIKGRK